MEYILLEDEDFQATTQIDCILIGHFTVPKMAAVDSYGCLASLITYTPTQCYVLLWHTDGSCYPQLECLRPVWLNRLTCGPNFCNNNYKVPAGLMLLYLCSTQYNTGKAGAYPHWGSWTFRLAYIYKWQLVAPKYLEGFCSTQYKNTRKQVLTLIEVPKPSGYPLHL